MGFHLRSLGWGTRYTVAYKQQKFGSATSKMKCQIKPENFFVRNVKVDSH